MNHTDVLGDVPRSVLASPPKQLHQHETDVLVLGAGATGLMAALAAARHARVIMLAHDTLMTSNSAWAQGGIAAALDSTDSPSLHVEDTLEAGAGLSDLAAVEMLAWEAPGLMHELDDLGVPFEQQQGHFVLGLEGSHSRRRILHVGDMTGWAITSTLVQRVQENPHIRTMEGYQAFELVTKDGRCTGALALDRAGMLHRIKATATILATGGTGALYGLTSNQPGALGSGIAMAYRAGAEVVDMEFVQFHPTVFQTRDGQGFLISEATRGEGGKLLSPGGERFMLSYHPRAELAPRDVVTRGIFAAMNRESSDHVLLDLTHLSNDYLEQRFPTITARCRAEGIDPSREPIPVAPAAHYLMGGVRVSLSGETCVPGLYAAGECACNGVHGANRLASNSLLECLVMGKHAALAAVVGTEERSRAVGSEEQGARYTAASLPQIPESPRQAHPAWQSRLAEMMRSGAGPLRSADRLSETLRLLRTFPAQVATTNADALLCANAVLAARLIVTGALLREESRGAHFRSDFPHPRESWHTHLVLGRGQQPYTVDLVADGISSPHTGTVATHLGREETRCTNKEFS